MIKKWEDLSEEEWQHVAQVLGDLANGQTCLHCHAPIESLKQVGRCVYALPCNHRQYQGRLPKQKVQETQPPNNVPQQGRLL